ncbi:MAG: type II restriction endonuclease [Gemmatimonadota bacterium]
MGGRVTKSVEAYHVLPRIREGFDSVDQFVEFASSVTNRRKARSGRSLELHGRCIFDEARERLPPTHMPACLWDRSRRRSGRTA